MTWSGSILCVFPFVLVSLKSWFMMGYLSCKAHSAIEVSNPHNPSPSRPKEKYPNEKPIKIQQFEYKILEAATDNFAEQKLLGRGSHGLVYKAILPSGRLVAVKKPSRRQQPTASDEFANEMHILANLYSPRFVNLVGVGYTNANESTENDRLLVVEFMANGTLYDVLHKNPKPPSWGRRIRLALQTAKAIETLHSLHPPVIHRDIKSANVLIDRNYYARLGDFGLALRCDVADYRIRSTPPAGTIGYLDPCYVTPENLSTKTDVFSFGILLLEIISGRKAIDVVHSPPSIVDWSIPLVRKGRLLAIYDPRIPPPKDPMVRKQMAVIAAKCVRSDRERRPSMKEIVKALDGLSKLVPLYSWNGFTNPCLMVENVQQQPVRLVNLDDVDGKPLKNSRRVYSDLGFRNNLMDLMAEPDTESQYVGVKHEHKACRALSFRIASERYVAESRASSLARAKD